MSSIALKVWNNTYLKCILTGVLNINALKELLLNIKLRHDIASEWFLIIFSLSYVLMECFMLVYMIAAAGLTLI